MARLVYSSGGSGNDGDGNGGSRNGRRGKVAPGAEDPQVVARPPEQHNLRVSWQRAGRKGKTVTLVAPVLLDRADAAELLRALKKRCGAGGALKAGDAAPAHWVLELQGDRVDAVLAWLELHGYPAKRSGG